MNENMKKFLEKAAQDPEFIAKMSAIQDPDEAYKMASALQDGFTREEFITGMKEFAAANGDLSDDDLKKFAGGDIEIEHTISGGVSATAVTVSCVAAAAI